jgi:serine/threonine-protein kinase
VAIVDYGLARIENGAEAGPSLSRAGVGFYFEPEYALSRLDGDASVPPTAAGEQYAIAALLYRLVTGNHYADFYFDERMWRQIATQVPLSFAERGTAAWSAGERVLRRALSKNPAARFANVGDFADALRIACPPPPSPVTSRQHFINMTRAFVDDLTRRIGSPRRIHSGADSAWVNDGSAGIAFGLYRLACIRQDGELLASADTMIEQACSGQTVPLGRTRQDADSASVSFYHGETGLQAVRAIISCAQCDMPAMGDAVAMFCSAAAAPSDDVDAFSGRASALIGTSLIINALPSNASAELSSLRAVGSSLAAYIDSYLERNHFSAEEGLPWLGIAHGWAGLLYATLLWSEVSGTAVTPATSATLTELGALAAESATASGDALFWPQRWASPGPLRRAEAGWCHGAAGHTLLQTAAYRVTGDDRHLRLAERAATFAYERYNGTGASLCCGLAGQAYACLSLLRVTDNDVWLRRAEQLAMRAIDRARAARYNDGLYTGLIGVGVLCADIGQPEHSHMPLFELDQM